ncbi:MAG: glycosyltransferase [Clostridia bacterium]
MKDQKLSFVIPCYGSEKTIAFVVNEIVSQMQKNNRLNYEITCVNDCSPDNVWSVLLDLCDQYPAIRAIDLAKNMTRIPAVMAGFAQSTGDIMIVLDDDGQCPMDHIMELLLPLDGEYDVSCAKYPEKKQSWFKNFGSRVNARMTEIMLEKPRELQFSNFLAIKRFVIDEILRYENPYPYLTGLLLRTTRHIANVEMEERERIAGRTNYTFKKLIALWLNGFTAFSVKPLRVATVVGSFTALLGFLWGFIIVFRKVLDPANILVGYSSIMAVLLFIGGMLMLMLGLVGEYVGRIYISINKSPQYVIRNIYVGRIDGADNGKEA